MNLLMWNSGISEGLRSEGWDEVALLIATLVKLTERKG